MGDVAQILGLHSTSSSSSTSPKKIPLPPPPPPIPKSHRIPRAIESTSTILKKPILNILSGQSQSSHDASSSTLPPIVPSNNLSLTHGSTRLVSKKRPASASSFTAANIHGGTNINNNTLTTSLTATTSTTTTTIPTQTTTAIPTQTKQPTYVKINNKIGHISTKKARSWIYAPFSSSARKDGLLLHHWVRDGVEYPDYPFARFDVHLDELSYRKEALEIENSNAGAGASASTNVIHANNNSNNKAGASSKTTATTTTGESSSSSSTKTQEELNTAVDIFYKKYLDHPKWTQSETDTLLELCRIHELRWPIIIDRWIGKFGSPSTSTSTSTSTTSNMTSVKKVEDLQHRYYTVGYILNRMKVERAAKVEAETLAKAMAAASAITTGDRSAMSGPGVVGGMGMGLGGGVGLGISGPGGGGISGPGTINTANITSGGGIGGPGGGIGGPGGGHLTTAPLSSLVPSSNHNHPTSTTSITNTSSVGSLGMVGGIPAGTGTGGSELSSLFTSSIEGNTGNNPNDISMQTDHVLASAIATSTSDAISSVIGDVQSNLQPPIATPNTGTSNQPTFDLLAERQRRQVLESLWSRTKEEELEEIELKKELKLVEAQIRKLKKSGGHILAAAAAAAAATSSASPGRAAAVAAIGSGVNSAIHPPGVSSTLAAAATSTSSSRGPSPVPYFDPNAVGTDASYNMLNSQFVSTVPTPTPGVPYLQSGRLKQPATGGVMGINKTTLKRMDQVLKELNVMDRPIPTKRVCDLYDHVRKGALMLLTLQKIMLKQESEVISRRLKLEKMTGTIVQERKAAADIAAAAAATAKANAAAAAAAAAASSSSTSQPDLKGEKTSGSGKTKSSGGATTIVGSSPSKTAAAAAAAAGGIGNTKKGSTGKGSSKKSTGSKDKKTKKKSSDGVTKKRKSSSKKNKDSSLTNPSATSAASSATSNSTGVPVPTSAGGPSAASIASAAAVSKPGVNKLNNDTKGKVAGSGAISTKNFDGKPSKKRAKKS